MSPSPKRTMSAETRARMSKAQRARWDRQRVPVEVAEVGAAVPPADAGARQRMLYLLAAFGMPPATAAREELDALIVLTRRIVDSIPVDDRPLISEDARRMVTFFEVVAADAV